MSRYFVDSAPIAVPEWDDDPNIISDRAPNVISIRSKMDVATKAKVTSEMFTLGKDNALEARLGSNELALLIHNIIRWDGPDLATVPCTRENIMHLDPTEPHIARVLEVIAERNAPPKAPKEPATPSSSTNDLGTASSTLGSSNGQALVMNGAQRSPLHSVIAGRRDKSGN